MEIKMDRYKYVSILLILLVLAIGTAIAVSDDDGIPMDDSWATKHSPIVTVGKDSTGQNITKVEFVLHDTDTKKAAQVKSVKDVMQVKSVFGTSGNCWETFATWNNNIPVKYVINPKNPQGLTQSFITSAIFNSAETWDVSTGKELFRNTYNIDSRAKYGKLDGKNSIIFGYYPYKGVIAVTGIWYNTDTGQIREFDMLFNTAYKWGDATINLDSIDLRDVGTHELGHSIGMDDIYDGTCADVTMYGYASVGETKKRTLETQDVTGLLSLYP